MSYQGKIVVAAIAPDADEPRWEYKNGVKDKLGEPKSEYSASISELLSKVGGYDIIKDFGENYGKTKPRDDIKMVLAMHGCRSQPLWAERFEYLDSLSDNVWCIMGTHLSKYVIYDRQGYSGGNSYAMDPDKWGDIDCVDIKKAEKLYNDLYEEFVESNSSKYDQPPMAERFEVDPFVVVTGQVTGDSSIYFTNFKTYLEDHNHANYQRTMVVALNELNKWGVRILYKPHPKEFGDWSWGVREIIKSGIWENCSVIEGYSIHQLFEKCLGVVTINSGAGFEALLHLKPVVTLGKVDYSVATRHCETVEDIAKAKDFVLNPTTQHRNFIKKFLLKHHENRAVANPCPYLDAARILESLS